MKYLNLLAVCGLFMACQNKPHKEAELNPSSEKTVEEKVPETSSIEDERDLKELSLDSLRNPNHYYYLNDLIADSLGKMILNGELKPGDNRLTFRLLDTLKYVGEDHLDFYLAVFERILDQADGALAEVMGGYCISFIYHQPEVFSSYITTKDTTLIRKWAEYSVYEMYFRFPEDSLMQKCTELNQRLINPDSLMEIKYFQELIKYEAQNLLNSGY